MAEEAILGALSAVQVSHCEDLIDQVRRRLADEPTPELFSQLSDVTEEDCRRAWFRGQLRVLRKFEWTGERATDTPRINRVSRETVSLHGVREYP